MFSFNPQSWLGLVSEIWCVISAQKYTTFATVVKLDFVRDFFFFILLKLPRVRRNGIKKYPVNITMQGNFLINKHALLAMLNSAEQRLLLITFGMRGKTFT